MLSGIKDDLLDAGKDEGCITFQHLNELLPDDVSDPKAIEEIFDFLGENNIEIVTQEKSGKKKTLSGEDWTGKDNPPPMMIPSLTRWPVLRSMKAKKLQRHIFAKWASSICSPPKMKPDIQKPFVRGSMQ